MPSSATWLIDPSAVRTRLPPSASLSSRRLNLRRPRAGVPRRSDEASSLGNAVVSSHQPGAASILPQITHDLVIVSNNTHKRRAGS